MSDRIIQQRQRRGTVEFGAPWGLAVKLATAASFVVMAIVIVVPQLVKPGRPVELWIRWLGPALILIVFGVTSIFSVRGFTVKGSELWIQRTFWQTLLLLKELKKAYADPTAMKGSLRLAGNGGFLALTGWFRNRKLGKYRTFVTDHSRCVVMEFKNRKVVVSPDDPEGFVKALGFETDSNRSPR